MKRHHAWLLILLWVGCARSTRLLHDDAGPVAAGHGAAADSGMDAALHSVSAGAPAPHDAGLPRDAGQLEAGPVQPVDCSRMPENLTVHVGDPAGYPSYALTGCQLLYVATDRSLRLQDLSTANEQLIAAASDQPSRPGLAGPASDPARALVWESGALRTVQLRLGAEQRTLRGDYEHSAQPRAARDAVVFSAFRGVESTSDSDVLLYEISSGRLSAVGTGPGQQQFADISDSQVAYSDFSEDPDGRFDDNGNDLADVVIVDRASLEHTRLSLPGKQAFPLLAPGTGLVYLNWALSHPEPKLSAYEIVAWDAQAAGPRMLAVVRTQPPFIRPSAFGDTVEWLETPLGDQPRLMRVPRSAAGEPKQAWSMPMLQPLANISTPSSTLMAVQGVNEPKPKLYSVPR